MVEYFKVFYQMVQGHVRITSAEFSGKYVPVVEVKIVNGIDGIAMLTISTPYFELVKEKEKNGQIDDGSV